MCIEQIEQQVFEERLHVFELKQKSPYYPHILYENKNNQLYASTLIRIKRNNVWYAVHLVKSIYFKSPKYYKDSKLELTQTMHSIAYNVLLFYNASNLNPDTLQISEKERMFPEHIRNHIHEENSIEQSIKEEEDDKRQTV